MGPLANTFFLEDESVYQQERFVDFGEMYKYFLCFLKYLVTIKTCNSTCRYKVLHLCPTFVYQIFGPYQKYCKNSALIYYEITMLSCG
jgi:hypothetical protein